MHQLSKRLLKESTFRRLVAGWGAAVLAAALLVAIEPLAVAPRASAATNPCSPVISAVACENTVAGDPQSDWMISGDGDETIQGYATQMSVNVGQTVNFAISTNAKAYHFDILRLGYYQGNGARKIASGLRPSATLPQAQPACQTFSDTGLVDCGNWSVSASWAVPASSVSGVYIAHLVRDDTGGSSWITFVVRNDASTSSVLFQTSDETWQAYNTYGGNSLYTCTVACPPGSPLAYKGAFKVSYNRPFHTALDDQGRSWLTYAEIPMIRFMESSGYDMSYMAGNDVATHGSLLTNHKAFVTSGHDEYWSYDQRANVEAARDKGVNVAMFTGNEIFWRTRWEPSAAGPATSGRTLVCYKDTHFNAPTDPVTWTGTYADPRFGTTTGGGNPQNALSGQFFNVNAGTTDIVVPSQYAKLRTWRNTAAAKLTGTQTLTLGSGLGTLGYEWDLDADDGFRPVGLFDLSSTTSTTAQVFTDYGSTVATGTATHNLTEYRAPSGALVFGAGTVQWSWGLDSFTTGKTPDLNMQQATVNILTDMGVQPATPASNIILSSASTDTTAPTSAIASPSNGLSAGDGALVTIQGTATDAGGGVVAGVEVSTDGGASWHPATGTTNWTYSWVAHGVPSRTIRSRAVDDSGNVESPKAGISVSIGCTCSLFGPNAKPRIADSGDPSGVEVGAQFYSDVDGTITGMRFYKASTNTGTHVGSLWTASGSLITSATFANESTSGWQTVTFAKPVSVMAGTRYVISYHAPKGHYTQDSGYFYPNHPSPEPAGSGYLDAPPLHFTPSVPGSPNGFYAYSSTTTFPNQIYDAEYYWVDPIFDPASSPAPGVTAATPSPGSTAVSVGTPATATFNQAVAPSSVAFTLKDSNNNSVPGTLAFNAGNTVATLTPNAALAFSTQYSATVSGATNISGQTMAAPYTWSFTTAAPPPAPAVMSTAPPAGAAGLPVNTSPSATFNQPVVASSVTFSLKDQAGTVVSGGTSWDSSGTTVTLTPAATLAYNVTYTATVSGAANSAGQTMAAPYSWSFTTAATPPAPNVTSASPSPGTTGVSAYAAITATFSQDVAPSSIQFTLKDASGATVAGSTSYSSSTTTATFTPSSSLSNNVQFTAIVSGATNSTGQSMSPYSWSFTTAPACPCTVFTAASTPSTANANDTGAVELGMKFRTDTAGLITGVRFYKGAQNTGTHIGNLWSSTGTKLATVTFVNETASGWQRAYFSSPVSVNANTTYVVSYFAPNGSYSFTSNGFSTAQGASPITGLANGADGGNGIYSYGSTSSFPASTFNATNYWVDAVFSPGTPNPPTVVGSSPSQGATGVPQSSTVSVTFDQAVDTSSATFSLTASGGTTVAGSTANLSAAGTYTFSPGAPLSASTTYTATVAGVKNSTGQVMPSAYSWSFTTASTGTSCPCSVFSTTSAPATVTVNDPNAVELGMQFTSDTAGSVTGIRFYKGSQNTGTHVGHLWSASGTLLASVTFTGESASGWQTANLSSPVAISANTTYVVSYFAPVGFYSASGNYFAAAADAPPLHGVASGTGHLNGVYMYGPSAFPANSYNATNYWVDVVVTTP